MDIAKLYRFEAVSEEDPLKTQIPEYIELLGLDDLDQLCGLVQQAINYF